MAVIYRALLPLPPPLCFGRSNIQNITKLRMITGSNPTMPKTDIWCRSGAQLTEGIAQFYDEFSVMWEDIWGDHIHEGFYDKHRDKDNIDHRAAQIKLIEQALCFAQIPEDESKRPRNVVDVGCGIGGSSRYLATKYGANVTGITLSPMEAARAAALTAAAGLGHRVDFRVEDAMNQSFPDGQFDLVWSMESAEHMPDKEKFMKELVRVAAPGGSIIIVTLCLRDVLPGEVSLKPSEQKLLDKICSVCYLPAWCSGADYAKFAQDLSLQDIKTADWSENIAPSSPAMSSSLLTWRGVMGFLRFGWKTIKWAYATSFIMKGYEQGLIKYAVIAARKPTRGKI